LAGRGVLVRADSAFYSRALIGAAVKAGAHVSVTVRMDPVVKRTIAAISDDDWTTIRYPQAIYDRDHRNVDLQGAGRRDRLHRVLLQEARRAGPRASGRAAHPDLNARAGHGQATLFETWRFHAFFTTTDLDTVTADQTHRRHAVIENVHADLKNSALAHLPSGVFTANAAWLLCAVMAFNLTRAAATTAGPALARATTATIRRKLIAVPARLATTARRVHLHLPARWPWADASSSGGSSVPFATQSQTPTPAHWMTWQPTSRGQDASSACTRPHFATTARPIPPLPEAWPRSTGP